MATACWNRIGWPGRGAAEGFGGAPAEWEGEKAVLARGAE